MTRIDPRTWLALLAPVALLLSGCVASATQDAPDDPLAADGASADADGARSAASTDSSRSAATPAAEDAAASAAVPVELEGETGLAAFVCVWAVVVSDCEGGLVPVTSVKTWFPQDLDGALQGVDLTMTWDAATPVGEELLLGLAIQRGDKTEWLVESGPSPVRFERSQLDVDAETKVSIYVWTPCEGELVVWTCATDPQPFRIEGTLLVATGE